MRERRTRGGCLRTPESSTPIPGSQPNLSAFTPPGDPGDLTCTILDQDGHVLGTQTAASQGGQFGSASVHCTSS